jgi:ubiquinol-cytochrome c reductase cytochrome c subunit
MRGLTMSIAVLVCGLNTSIRAADAAKGKEIFIRVGCFECHGTLGQGGISGAQLAPDPIPLTAMRDFLRTTQSDMPAYSAKALPDSAIDDIYAYLSSIAPPPDPNTIPLLKD